MEKRLRSPNYPALSLPEALDKVTSFYENLHTHTAPRVVAAKAMGYNALHGASATAISALHKYGLLERVGDEIRVSELSLRILAPQSPEERAEAIRTAADLPPLFAKLNERFPGRLPNEELLRNYLIREKFSPSAANQVLLAYRETYEFVNRETMGHDSAVQQPEEVTMAASSMVNQSAFQSPKVVISQEAGRQIARYDYEGGGFVKVLVGGDVETGEALQMLKTLIGLKEKELERGKGKSTLTVADLPDSTENQ